MLSLVLRFFLIDCIIRGLVLSVYALNPFTALLTPILSVFSVIVFALVIPFGKFAQNVFRPALVWFTVIFFLAFTLIWISQIYGGNQTSCRGVCYWENGQIHLVGVAKIVEIAFINSVVSCLAAWLSIKPPSEERPS